MPETRAIGDARPSAFRPTWWSGQERFDKIPQRIGKQRRSHTRSRYFADEDHVSTVLLRVLKKKPAGAFWHPRVHAFLILNSSTGSDPACTVR